MPSRSRTTEKVSGSRPPAFEEGRSGPRACRRSRRWAASVSARARRRAAGCRSGRTPRGDRVVDQVEHVGGVAPELGRGGPGSSGAALGGGCGGGRGLSRCRVVLEATGGSLRMGVRGTPALRGGGARPPLHASLGGPAGHEQGVASGVCRDRQGQGRGGADRRARRGGAGRAAGAVGGRALVKAGVGQGQEGGLSGGGRGGGRAGGGGGGRGEGQGAGQGVRGVEIVLAGRGLPTRPTPQKSAGGVVGAAACGKGGGREGRGGSQQWVGRQGAEGGMGGPVVYTRPRRAVAGQRCRAYSRERKRGAGGGGGAGGGRGGGGRPHYSTLQQRASSAKPDGQCSGRLWADDGEYAERGDGSQ